MKKCPQKGRKKKKYVQYSLHCGVSFRDFDNRDETMNIKCMELYLGFSLTHIYTDFNLAMSTCAIMYNNCQRAEQNSSGVKIINTLESF